MPDKAACTTLTCDTAPTYICALDRLRFRRPGLSWIMRVMDWSNFYITVATAAATLLGLLFVAVQFNLEQLPADQSQPWLATNP